MIDISYLKTLFQEKLEDTGSLDAAFTKAVWVAYKQGIEDQKKATTDTRE